MNIHKIVNIICGAAGVGVLLFSLAVKMGMIEGVDPSRSTLPFILGVIIIAWAGISHMRHR